MTESADYSRVQMTWTLDTVPEIGYRHRTCTLVARRPYYSRIKHRSTAVLTWEHDCPRCGDRFRFTTGITNVGLPGICQACFWEEAATGRFGPFWQATAEGARPVVEAALEQLAGPKTFRVFGRTERLTWRGKPVTQEDLAGAYIISTRESNTTARRLTAKDTAGWLHPLRGQKAVSSRRTKPEFAQIAADLAAMREQVTLLRKTLALLSDTYKMDTMAQLSETGDK